MMQASNGGRLYRLAPPGARKDLRSEFGKFCADQANWLEDYALFRALKAKYRGAYYLDWPAKLVQRRPDAIAQAQRELATQIDQVRFAKFLLSRQAEINLRNTPMQKALVLLATCRFSFLRIRVMSGRILSFSC